MTAPGPATNDTWFRIRCLRCGRAQPSLPRGVDTCVYCSAALPVPRWRAAPPPGVALSKPVPARPAPYLGPPSYQGTHPRWGFPAVIWRPAEVPAADANGALKPRRPVAGTRVAMVATLLTSLACLAAAAAEFWRFRLLLRGRSEVLPDVQVTSSDTFVGIAGWTSVGLCVLTGLIVLPVLIRWHVAGAARAGLEPSRRPAGVLSRLIIPGWNVYGAGQVIGEIDGVLALPPAHAPGPPNRPRLSGLASAWWWSWVINAAVVVVTLIRAFGRTDQAMADTVELHIGVDVMGAVVAGLTFLLLRRCRARFEPAEPDPLLGWVVAPPPATSDRGTRPEPNGSARPDQMAAVMVQPVGEMAADRSPLD